MKNYTVTIGDIQIPYYLSKDYQSTEQLFQNLDFDCFYIIYDEFVNVDLLVQVIGNTHNYKAIPVRIPENMKNIHEMNRLLEQLIELGVTRNSCLVAVGGGVVGNVVGFIASLLYRGISFIHIPTTIMAASDSVLSIKQAVNSDRVKNIIGAYYPPVFICTIYPLFESLPQREYYAGLVEFVKNVLIFKNNYEQFIQDYDFKNFNTYEQFETLMELSIKAKNQVLSTDPHERNEAIILEYGHTYGHSIEMLTEGKIHHGEGVAFGLLAAAYAAQRLGFIGEEQVIKHQQLLKYIIPSIKEICNLDPIMIRNGMQKDNKRGYIPSKEKQIAMVILQGSNKISEFSDCSLENVDHEIIVQSIADAIDYIKKYEA